MKDQPNGENPTMLDRMAGENETLGAAVMALFITLVMKAMGLGKTGTKMTRKHHGFNAKDVLGVLDAGRMGALMDIGLNKANTADLVFHVRDSGIDRLTIIDDNGQPRHLILGASSYVDKALNTTNGRRCVSAMLALRRVKMLDQVRLDALRRSLATDSEEIEEGYAPANRKVRDAFGLDEGDVVRYVSLEGSHIMQGDLKSKQGVQQYATREHFNLNADGVVDWFKVGVDSNAYYCGECTKAGERGFFPSHYPPGAVVMRGANKGAPLGGQPHPNAGKAVPVNWSSPAVLDDKVSAKVAAKWGIPEAKTGTRRCPTCDCHAAYLSQNGNTAHLPLLTFNGNEAGVASTDMGAVRAVAFRMAKTTFKVVQGVLKDTHTPEQAVTALMGCHGIRYRENMGDTVWRPARLVPVWFHYPHTDGSHTDRLGLALEPIAHAGGVADINA